MRYFKIDIFLPYSPSTITAVFVPFTLGILLVDCSPHCAPNATYKFTILLF
jgi:hypothetical protein